MDKQFVITAIHEVLKNVEPAKRLRVLGTVAAEISRAGGVRASGAQAKLDSMYQSALFEVETWYCEKEPPRWKPVTFRSCDFADDIRLVSVTGPAPLARDKLRLIVKELDDGWGSVVCVMRFVDGQHTASAAKFYPETGAALRKCLREEVFEPLGFPAGSAFERQICNSVGRPR